MLPVAVYPCGYFAQAVQPGFAEPVPSTLFDDDEAAIRQDPDMERYRLAADLELFGNGVHIMGLIGDHADDRPAGGIGDGLVYVTSGFHDNMQVSACKYKRKHLLAQIFLPSIPLQRLIIEQIIRVDSILETLMYPFH